MISTNEKLAKKQRKILGPLGRLLLKVFRWEIKGKIPDLEKMILIGIPHTAMRCLVCVTSCMGIRFKNQFFWSSMGIYKTSKFIYYIKKFR